MNVSVMCFKLIKCLSVQSFDNKILNRLNRIEYWNDLLKNCQGIKLLSSCNSYSTGQKSSNYSKSTEQNRQLTFKPHAKTGHRQTKKKKKKNPDSTLTQVTAPGTIRHQKTERAEYPFIHRPVPRPENNQQTTYSGT